MTKIVWRAKRRKKRKRGGGERGRDFIALRGFNLDAIST
jgi:hypothetical protein